MYIFFADDFYTCAVNKTRRAVKADTAAVDWLTG